MRFAANTLFTSACLLAAVLLAWQPAHDTIRLTPVDWAAEHQRAYAPASTPFGGAMSHARELIRRERRYLPLTDFIEHETDGCLRLLDENRWQNVLDRFSQSAIFLDQPPAYFRRTELPLDDAGEDEQTSGYFAFRRNGATLHLRHQRLRPGDPVPADLPPALRYPNRPRAILLLALACLPLLPGTFGSGHEKTIARSSAGKGCRVFIFLAATGIAMIILPFLHGRSDLEPPFVFVGGFVTLVGTVGLAAFGHQARLLGRWLRGDSLLADWSCTENETSRRDRPGPGRVLIGNAGLYLNGSVHNWDFPGSRLEKVKYIPGQFPELHVTYSYITTRGRSLVFIRQFATITLSVPGGRASEAEALANSMA